MGKEIANWKEDMQKAAVKTAKDERPAESYISLKGGVMTYQDNALPDNKVEVVIIASSYARACFNRPYDADDNDPPECFANAIDKKDLVPHPNVPTPFAEVCSEKLCPMAEFGSALQGKGPRCKTRRKLIVMPVSGLDNPAEAEFATIAVPPTSGKNYSNYAAKIASSEGLPPWAVKTMITCKPHAKNSFEVVFEATGKVTDEKALAGIHARIQEAETILLQPYEYDQVPEAGTKEDDKPAKY